MIITFFHRAVIIRAAKRYFSIAKWVGITIALLRLCIERMQGVKRTKRLFVSGMADWSIGIYCGDPFHLRPPKEICNPVLTARDVHDVPAVFVADPFIVEKGGLWYMFFEVFSARSRKGEIGLATSANGFQWKYERIILQEPFHLSYPYVFEWEGAYYLVPESSGDQSIRLYKAIDFPTRWSFVGTILRGVSVVDTTLFYDQGIWYLFAAALKGHDTLFLYYAETLMGPWVEHPLSPIVQGNPSIARPAGRAISVDGHIFRYAQDCSAYYGEKIRILEITTLTPTAYAEREIQESPLIKASGHGWNRKGMHTVDLHMMQDNQWIAAVDGFKQHLFFVGY